MLVIKRDGVKKEYYKLSKILNAVEKCGSKDAYKIAEIANQIIQDKKVNAISVQEIEKVVEETLIKHDTTDCAREYISYRSRHQSLSEPDPEGVSSYMHAAKYARWDLEKKRLETWEESVDRVKAMHERQIRKIYKFSDVGLKTVLQELDFAMSYVYDKKVVPSMRSLQFGGAGMEAHHARGYNCSFTRVNRPEVFGQIFYTLLCGCGVGYSVQKHHVAMLPKLAKMPKRQVGIKWVTVEDTIEGWGDAVKELIDGYVYGYHVEFNYSKIRPEGTPLVTGGGKAPGHVPLRKALEETRRILDNAEGRKLTPIECSDIICHLADAVLSGGIRRSALICLFSFDDKEMFYAKTPENMRYAFGDDKGKNTQRAYANNSAVLLRSEATREMFDQIMDVSKDFGEPGFFLTDSLEAGTNPCAEIGLNPTEKGFQFCNLTEVKACEDLEEMSQRVRAATILGTIQASYTDFPYLGEETEISTRREALLGVSLTGLADCPSCHRPEFLQALAKISKESNEKMAKCLDIQPAARITTVKPSGSASLVLNCASGIHPHHAKRTRRGVTANPNEAVAQEFKASNPGLVHVKPNGDWFLEFPIKAPEGSITVKSETAIEFLERVTAVYENWVAPGYRSGVASHNVSATVSFEQHELDDCLDYIWENRHRFAALSFAPKMLDESIPYCPRVEVKDKEEWNRLCKIQPVDYIGEPMDRMMEAACAGGACEI